MVFQVVYQKLRRCSCAGPGKTPQALESSPENFYFSTQADELVGDGLTAILAQSPLEFVVRSLEEVLEVPHDCLLSVVRSGGDQSVHPEAPSVVVVVQPGFIVLVEGFGGVLRGVLQGLDGVADKDC